jgi:uncharacterized protein (DUF1684 family)
MISTIFRALVYYSAPADKVEKIEAGFFAAVAAENTVETETSSGTPASSPYLQADCHTLAKAIQIEARMRVLLKKHKAKIDET